ncbi:MAG: isopeptide-forming domain-containing fimbrial protein [Clostridiales bacterium]|nr:isopeptide-forming domain-containing fimbrial protein [Clostridiales bacterium]
MNFGTLSVMADGDTYTITIKSDKTGHTYDAYQIFTGDLSDDGNTLSNVKWGTGIDGTELITLLKADSTVGSLFKDCKTAADVADVLGDGTKIDSDGAKIVADIIDNYLSTNSVSATATSTGGTELGSDSKYTYTISGVSAGYYLVKDRDDSVIADGDAYTDIILQVVNDVEVNAKAVYPTVTKTVNQSSYYEGETVTFTLTGTVPDTSAYDKYEYIFNDTMSPGLTYNTGSITVKVDDSDVDDTEYSVSTGTYTESGSEYNGGTTIKVSFEDVSKYSGKSIVVTYTATLNENAVVGNDGNPNKVYLEYSNNPNTSGGGEKGKTPEKEVVVFTFEVDVTKVDGTDNTKTLEGAKFVLMNSTQTMYAVKDSDGKISWVSDSTQASTFESDANGEFSIVGLGEGTYYLKETVAPDGYNLLSDLIKIEIEAEYEDASGTDTDDPNEAVKVTTLSATVTVGTGTGTTASGDADEGTVDVTVENKSGAVLPSTGGMGTKIFYTLGGILVIGAGVLLIVKRRMRND